MSLIELLHHPNGTSVLRLNRPELRNALSWEAMDLFAEHVAALHARRGLRALIVSGEGGAFCSGGDLVELDQYLSRADGERLAQIMGDALARLEALAVPTLAAIEGPALGGGAEIALACDLRLMAEGSSLGLMHIRLGITPAWGGGQRLFRLVGYARAFEWLATGKVLTPDEAELHGVANRVVGRGHALRQALEMAADLAAKDPAALAAVKRLLRAGVTFSSSRAAEIERQEFPPLWADEAHRAASAEFLARKATVARR